MIQVVEKSNCSGCSACVSSCKKNCITMLSDNEGFSYPVVDEEKCIQCGACDSACPIINKKHVKEHIPRAYAVVSLNEAVRLESSSGGVFSLVSEAIISDGGVVFGAAFNETFDVEHIMVSSLEELAKLRGSKYVQSKIGDSYIKTEKILKEGRPVLFTGTPCQIAGLKAYLKTDYDNLFCQDIICHGVPSPLAWRACLDEQEKSSKSTVSGVSFRDKSIGWKQYSLRIEFENKKVYKAQIKKDSYMRAFLQNLILRPSCFACNFKTVSRSADITLADLWGAQSIAPELDDNKGTSFVILHSEKGEKLFERISGFCRAVEIDLQSGISHNQSMIESEERTAARDDFMNKLITKGYSRATSEFCKDSFFELVKNFGLRVFRRIKLVFSKVF